MVYIDIKSVGPRDNFEHIVVSPYQISGDGLWESPEDKFLNSRLEAHGARASHYFHPAVPPIYIFSNGCAAPTVHVFVKPVYSMKSIGHENKTGQPLENIRIITAPNGLLLTVIPNYLEQYPGLLFPGKDDKTKAILKVRARLSFDILRTIGLWRVQTIQQP